MKKLTITISLGLILTITNVFAEGKGAEALVRKPTTVTSRVTPATDRVSSVAKEKSRVSYSIHSRGFVGNYEIVTLRERGLWGNGCLTQLIVDRDGNPVGVLNSSASAGPGIALIQGASFVGGMYLFADHLKPSNQNVSGGSSSATGGSSSARSHSNSNGGKASATGGNGNGNGGNGTGGNDGGNGTGGNDGGNGGNGGNGGDGNGHSNHSGGGDNTNPGGHGNDNGSNNPGNGNGHGHGHGNN